VPASRRKVKKLQMAMPDFADPTKAKALKNQITEYAVENIGLSENEARRASPTTG
jgi:hypothetical protein